MAQAAVVGVLRALLTADTAQFDTSMRRVAATTKQTETGFTKFGASAKNALAPTNLLRTGMVALSAAAGGFAAAIGVGAVRALTDLAFGAFDAGSKLVDLSNKTGLTTTTLQRMSAVGDQTGVSLDQMSDAAFRLGVRLDGGGASVRRAVDKLGLSFEAIKNQRPDQQWESVIQALARMENVTERNRIGVDLFGRSFATVTPILKDYQQIVDQTTVVSDAQVQSLDRAADRWAKFKTDVTNSIRAAVGSILLYQDALREVVSEQEKAGQSADSYAQANYGLEQSFEALRRRQLGLVGARTADIQLTDDTAQANESYAQQLAKVRAELARLTPAQRAEIDAARQLGVSADELEDKFGLTAGALRVLTAGTKAATKELQALVPLLNQASAGLATTAPLLVDNKAFLDVYTLTAGFGVDAMDDYARATAEANEELARQGMILPDLTLENQNISQSIGIVEEESTKAFSVIGSSVEQLNVAIAGSFAQMALGAKRFKEGWIDIWNSIKAFTLRIFSEIAGAFVTGLLKKMAAGLAGTAAAGAAGSAIAGGSGAAAGTAAGAGGGGLAGGGFLANPAFWTNPYTIGAIAAIAVGTLIWKKGLFRGGEEALKVNPRRDAFQLQFGGPPVAEGGAKLAAMLTGFTGQPGGGPWFAAMQRADSEKEFEIAQAGIVGTLQKFGKRVRSFEMGGFVPPGAIVPAVLHGGMHGEVITPLRSAGGSGSTMNAYITIQAWDGEDAVRQLRKHGIPFLKQAFTLNTDNITTTIDRAQRGIR